MVKARVILNRRFTNQKATYSATGARQKQKSNTFFVFANMFMARIFDLSNKAFTPH